MTNVKRLLGSLALASLLVLPGYGAATITIVNADGAGEGFNDATIVPPVGGNPGTTLGQQRLNVFQAAANIWGATLTSVPAILVLAQFNPQTCTATGAILGSAGPRALFADPTGTVLSPANSLFHAALANKLSSVDNYPPTVTPPDGGEEIAAVFNSDLGGGGIGVASGCGFTFYLGLDNNPPAGQTDLLTVVLHELAHGLGFSTTTNGSTGARLAGFNSKYDTFLFDTTQGLSWPQMTDTQRATSALNSRKLVWTGANVTGATPTVLSVGTPELQVSAPASLAGTYLASALQGAATAYPNLTLGGVSGEVMPALDSVAPFSDACTPLTAASALGVNGKVAIVDRGTCTFNTKLAIVTAAGATGMILVNNAAGTPPPMTGPDLTPAIPTVVISQADGAALNDFLRFRSRTKSGLLVTLRLNANRSGADASNRAVMFTPNPFQSGSSVSHFDPIMFPSQLMEPSFSLGLTHSVIPPSDLTFRLLQDLGW
jgi:hypothetical protein